MCVSELSLKRFPKKFTTINNTWSIADDGVMDKNIQVSTSPKRLVEECTAHKY